MTAADPVTAARPPAGGPPGGPAIVLEDATARRGARPVWEHVDLAIGQGDFVAVLGSNGAGKSTLLEVILGLLPLQGGRATVLGRPAGVVNEQIGYLPQRRHFDAASRIRGVDLVRLGLDGARWGLPRPRWLGGRRGDALAVAEVIELVGAADFAERPMGALSGGEQQRLLIAQALVRRPRVLMLDEPLDSLDLSNQGAIAALVGRICSAEGISVLLVAHDVNPILGYIDRIVYFAGGRAIQGPPAQVITSATLSELYGAPIEVLHASDGRTVVVGLPEAPHVHSDRHAH